MAQYDYWPKFSLENYSYTFPIEEKFNPVESTVWMQKNWTYCFLISTIYMALIHLGQKYMKSRKAFLLDNSLFWWNMSLAIFSFTALMRIAPEMFWSVHSNSFVYSICSASYAQGVTGFWAEKFAMSKFLELIDTAFIILRKKPLIFLHWYHHVTVLVYTWHAYKEHTSSGRWFILMNYAVHAFMYSYYALRSLRFCVPKSLAMLITLLQILQMIIGVFIGVTVYFLKSQGTACQQTWTNLYFSFAIYFSYFLLFCNFFYQTYLKSNNRYLTAKLTKYFDLAVNNNTLHNDECKQVRENSVGLTSQNDVFKQSTNATAPSRKTKTIKDNKSELFIYSTNILADLTNGDLKSSNFYNKQSAVRRYPTSAPRLSPPLTRLRCISKIN